MRTSRLNAMEQGTCKITINGVTMTYAEYKKQLAKQKKANTAKRTKTYIQEIPPYIESMIKEIKVLKSLIAFRKNGYRQWGTIANTIMGNAIIVTPMAKFVLSVNAVNEELNRIALVGKKNEKDIFQLVQMLSDKLDDTRNAMVELAHAVDESRVCTTYKDKEIINGIGRRLGLRELMQRSLYSLNTMDNTIKDIKKLGEKGLPTFMYSTTDFKSVVR